MGSGDRVGMLRPLRAVPSPIPAPCGPCKARSRAQPGWTSTRQQVHWAPVSLPYKGTWEFGVTGCKPARGSKVQPGLVVKAGGVGGKGYLPAGPVPWFPLVNRHAAACQSLGRGLEGTFCTPIETFCLGPFSFSFQATPKNLSALIPPLCIFPQP